MASTIRKSSIRRQLAIVTDSSTYCLHQALGFTIVEQARQGVPSKKVDQLAQMLNLSFKEFSAILQVSERTLRRFRNAGQLNVQASERLLLVENLAAHGLQVFDNRSDALADWLRYPLRELKGQIPLQLLTTINGFDLVDDVLTRIEYGVYV